MAASSEPPKRPTMIDVAKRAGVSLKTVSRVVNNVPTVERVEVFSVQQVPGVGKEQGWFELDAGSQSVWPTVTGPNFESGFSDSILQMWAVFLAERADALGDRFGAARPEEAAFTHAIYRAAIESHREHAAVRP